jgi:hypothetical protein
VLDWLAAPGRGVAVGSVEEAPGEAATAAGPRREKFCVVVMTA